MSESSELRDQILFKCLSGEATDVEYEEAYKWIHSDKDNLHYYRQFLEAFLASGLVLKKRYYDADKGWKRVQSRNWISLVLRPEAIVRSGLVKVAASLAILLVSIAMIYQFVFRQALSAGRYSEKPVVIEAPLGAKTLVVLSDETKVWLNAGSRIEYSTSYDVKQRDVYLLGEAYFEVASNERLPFRVHASDVVVEALGTSFNVKAYPEESLVEATLVSGLATIERLHTSGQVERVLLRPNQKVSVPVGGDAQVEYLAKNSVKEPSVPVKRIDAVEPVPVENIIVDKYVNTTLYTSWKDKRWFFQRERMADLVVKLERIYDVRITFKDEEVMDYYLTGTLEQETLEQLLAVIRLTIPMDFSIYQNHVVLSLNKELKDKYEKLSH